MIHLSVFPYMPRQSRVDYPDAYHHVIARGVERRAIFLDDQDRQQFIARLESTLLASGTQCFAWALIPNHFHLLLQTGRKSISLVLLSLLTSYALYFNRRWKRSGHLFQNRFHSKLCEDDRYFLSLISYIHLNPLRAGLVQDLDQLAHYPWSGHAAILSNTSRPWQNVNAALEVFHSNPLDRKEAYVRFLRDDLNQQNPKLASERCSNSELRRTTPGSWKPSDKSWESFQHGEERILGSEDFHRRCLESISEPRYAAANLNIQQVLKQVSQEAKIPLEEIPGNGKRPAQCFARALACKWLHDELALSQTEIARQLRIALPTVSINAIKGRHLIQQLKLSLKNI